AVFIISFPYLLFSLVKVSSCEGPGGACGALAAVAGFFLRPVAMIVFIIFMSVIIFKRCRTTYMSIYWVLPSLVFVLASAKVLVGFNNFWGANFGLGIIGITFPPTLIVFLAFIIFLSFYERDYNPDRLQRGEIIAWKTAAVSSLIVVVLNLSLLLLPLLSVPSLGQYFVMPVFKLQFMIVQALSPLQYLLPVKISTAAVYVFIGALSYILYASKRDGDDSQTSSVAARDVSHSGPPRLSRNSGRIPTKTFGRRR
ncbi:MAG: hypothetical protein AAGA76_14480, partial [Pseudomonadota bacterium]